MTGPADSGLYASYASPCEAYGAELEAESAPTRSRASRRSSSATSLCLGHTKRAVESIRGHRGYLLDPQLKEKPAVLFEDGLESRDFVHIRDVARANVLAPELDRTDGMVLSIGPSRRTTLFSLFEMLQGVFGDRLPSRIAGTVREGDIRFVGIGRIRSTPGLEPAFGTGEGVNTLAAWAHHPVAVDRANSVINQLQTTGLVPSL